MHNLDLDISDISKIEGKASCRIQVRKGEVKEVKFTIAEYKRFYTQAIRGKDIVALPQHTARICGTCSNIHLLCAIKAIEDAVGLVPSRQTIMLRKLLNYGLVIRDHALHLYVFVLPDIFSKDSLLDFDENDPQEHKFLDDAFSIKSAGNLLGKVVGGRSVHAPFVGVGGFIKLSVQQKIKECSGKLQSIRPKVLDLIDFLAEKDGQLNLDNLDFTALGDDELSFLSGNILKGGGGNISPRRYGQHLKRIAISYSHASGYRFDGKVYMVGALARLNLFKKNLHQKTRNSIKKHLALFPSKNIFHNNLAQAIEILHAVDSSLEIIEGLDIIYEKPISPVKRKGVGIGVVEAPRGTLYYKLEVSSSGKIDHGQIVVPTGQNQVCIEEAIKKFLQDNLEKIGSREEIERNVERIVRAFDPCMSCASHFLKFRWIEEQL